jgi:hypothetical protein
MIPTWQENKMNDSAFDTGERSAFDSWYNGMVGFHINSERILEDLNFPIDYGYVDPKTVRKWLAVCWNNALDAAQEYNGVDVEVLKEKI